MKMEASTSPNGCCRAFTLLEMLVSVAVIIVAFLLLAGFLIFSERNSYERRKGNYCLSHLKQAGLGFVMWASDHGDQFPMHVSTNEGGTREYDAAADTFRHVQTVVESRYISETRVLVCPADSQAKIAPVSCTDMANSNLSYFVSLSASYGSNVSGVVLLGDRNLTRNEVALRSGLYQMDARHIWGWNPTNLHKGRGNLLFADGHVESVRSTNLQGYLTAATTTNLLSVP